MEDGIVETLNCSSARSGFFSSESVLSVALLP
jgi:hypothetical protein